MGIQFVPKTLAGTTDLCQLVKKIATRWLMIVMHQDVNVFSASVIGVSHKTLHNQGRTESWPLKGSTRQGNPVDLPLLEVNQANLACQLDTCQPGQGSFSNYGSGH